MRRLPASVGFLSAVGRGAADLTRWLVSLFSRSLQVRIVVLTVLLTLVSIFVPGPISALRSTCGVRLGSGEVPTVMPRSSSAVSSSAEK